MEQTKTGYKSLNKLAVLPGVNSAITTTTNLYEKLKNTNAITRATLDFAEISFQTFNSLIALPLVKIAKNPIDRLDNFVSDKIDVITETSNKLSTRISNSYDHQVKNVTNIKLEAQAKSKQIRDFMITCFIFLNTVLENTYVKFITEPVLNVTENLVNYACKTQQVNEQMNSKEKSTTLNRVFMIYQKVYKGLSQQFKSVFFTHQKPDFKLY